MGVKIVSTGMSFFQQINQPKLAMAAKILSDAGVQFEISFFNVMFVKDGKTLAKAMLPKSTTSMLKGSMQAESVELCCIELAKQMCVAGNQVGVGDSVKAAVTLNGTSDVTSYDVPTPMPPPAKPSVFEPEMPMKKKIKAAKAGSHLLRDATAVLQKVKGTDPSSVYITVGIGDAANLAVRYVGDAVSFRAEPRKALSSTSQHLLASLGFQQSGNGHWSMHFQVAEPNIRARVLGSVISGLMAGGLKFECTEIDYSKVIEQEQK